MNCGGAMPMLPGVGGSNQALLAGGGAAEDDDMVTLGKVQGQLRVSSLRRLTSLVDQHPDETLSIIRGWIAQERR